MRKRKKIIVLFLLLSLLFSTSALAFDAGYFSVEGIESQIDSAAADVLANTDLDMSDIVYNELPYTYNIRLVPGVDFLKTEDYSEETVKAEIDEMLSAALASGMNSVTVVPTLDDFAVYNSNILPILTQKAGTENTFDPLGYISEKCKEQSIDFSIEFDAGRIWQNDGTVRAPETLSDDETLYLCEQIKEIARLYTPDNITITNISAKKTAAQYELYRLENDGRTYEEWLRARVKDRIQAIVLAGQSASKSIRFGLKISPVWAYNTEKDSGIALESNVPSALYSKNIDTKNIANSGLLQYVLVETTGSLEDSNQPFEEIVSWWSNNVTNESVRLYVTVDNQKDGGEEAGWGSPDQMARMLVRAAQYPKCTGAFFTSLTALRENKNGSTDILLKYIEGALQDLESLFKDLTFFTPQKTTFTTYEDRVLFYGTGDSNFEILINGEPAVTNEQGEFYAEVPLDVGLNLVTFEHKGTKVVYRITRNIQLITDVSPSGAITALGNSKITVVATAYRGSSVTASLYGSTVTLYEDTSQQTDSGQSVYTTYVGSISLPPATATSQALGSITVRAYHSEFGITETALGGSVTVMASIIDPDIPDTGEGGSSVIQGGTMVEIVGSNVRIYPADTLDIFSTPDYYTLPAGTIDYIVGGPVSCTYNGVRHNYYILKSGVRIEDTNVRTISGEHEINSMSIDSITSNGSYTEVTLSTQWKVPFICGYAPLSYYSSGGNDYNVSSFGANSFSVSFAYTGSGGGTTSCSQTPLFSGAKWSTSTSGGVTRSTLTFSLTSSGSYYGMKAYYNSSGKLVLRFNNTPILQSASNAYGYTLNGLRVVLDPGHSEGEGAINGSIGVREKVINAAICTKTAEILRQLGATVTISSPVEINSKRAEAQSIQPHIYISFHQNSGSSTAKGAEAYYFNPFSMPLAKSITDQIVKVYSSSGQHSVNRGIGQANYAVTCDSGYAAVLVEYGFISNNSEGLFLAKDSTQQAMAEATVRGIINYLL